MAQIKKHKKTASVKKAVSQKLSDAIESLSKIILEKKELVAV